MNYAVESTVVDFARSKAERQFEARPKPQRHHVLSQQSAQEPGSGRLELASEDIDIPDLTRDLYAAR